jgi:hypothetical protein
VNSSHLKNQKLTRLTLVPLFSVFFVRLVGNPLSVAPENKPDYYNQYQHQKSDAGDKLTITKTTKKDPTNIANNAKKSIQNHFCLRGHVIRTSNKPNLPLKHISFSDSSTN